MRIAMRVLIAIGLALVVLMGFTSCGTIETGNVGVRTTLGNVNVEEIEPGVFLGLPGISKVSVFSAKEIGLDLNDLSLIHI